MRVCQFRKRPPFTPLFPKEGGGWGGGGKKEGRKRRKSAAVPERSLGEERADNRGTREGGGREEEMEMFCGQEHLEEMEIFCGREHFI